jgi:ankyrin repeat protein
VKQLPVTGVPDIVYQVPSYNDILEVFPHQGWIEASRTIRVGRPNSEGVLGVIRYNTVAEVVDILIGIASERTSVHAAQFWCLQIPAAGTSSLIDVASQFNQDRHRLDDRKLANQSSRGTSLASVEMLRINNKQVLAVSLKEVAELDAMTITHYPELHLGDDLSVVPWLKKIEDLFEVLFEDSNWYMGRSADKQATSLGQARSWTRPIVRASDPHELSRLLRQLSTKFFQPALQSAPASWFTVEKADWSPASAFETYFSVLLIEACARNDVSATAELLDSVLKSSALVEARTVGLPPDEQQAYVAFEGFRPLHWATAFGNISVVRLLLQHNARVMSRTNLGLTSIDLASMLGHTEILGALFLAYGGMTDMYLNTVPLFESPCHLAAAYVTSNEVEPILRMLLPSSTATSSSKHRHPSNYVWNSMNETPLHRAAAMGNLIAVKAILKLDTEIDVELADAQGRTPLWHAAATGRLEIVKLFIWYGSRINRADTQGRNPIHAACRGGHAEVVQVLLDAWGKSPVPSPLSFTLSHFAAMSGSPKTLRVLRDCGQTLDDFEVGVAPIHIATVNTASYHRSRDFGLGPYSKVADYETCEDFLRHAGCDTSRRGSFSVFVDDSRPSGIAVVNSPCLPRRHHYMKYPPQVDL